MLAKRPILQTVLLCLIALLLTFPPHFGFIIYLVVLFLIPAVLKSIYFILIKKIEVKQRLIQSILWVLMISITLIHHVYLAKSTKLYAQSIVDSIVSYHSEYGVYPESLDLIGVNQDQLKKYRIAYLNKSPSLFYYSTWMVYSHYRFDFDIDEWVYHSD